MNITKVNHYEVEYSGKYSLDGTVLTLTGDETWQGAFVDASSISGTWCHIDGVCRTFTATRK